MVNAKKVKELLSENRFWKSVLREEIPVSEYLKTKILGMGLVNFYLFVLLFLTGILLMFYYIPHTERAYRDIQDIVFAVSFGRIIRNMHRWSAYLMITGVFLHMCRVFYTAEYRAPREFNWVTGLALFLCTLMMGLTGYILPWDQKAYWGMTIISNVTSSVPLVGSKLRYLVLGGTEVGQNALLRAYVMHVRVLPLIFSFVVAMHFWRIRKDDLLAANLSAAPTGEERAGNNAIGWGELLRRESAKGLIILSIVMFFSIMFDAPLEEAANSAVTPNPAKAPWFFVGLQEMLSWGAPFWFAIVIPNAVAVGLLSIPYLDRSRGGVDMWFHPSRRIHNILFTAFVVVLIGLIIVGYFLRGPGWEFYWPWEPWPIH